MRCMENLLQRWQLDEAPLEPAQHLARGLATVASFAVGEMLLPVVLGDEPGVDGTEFLPTRRPLEVVVGHSSHDVEVALDIVLPGSAAFDLLFVDTKPLVDLQGMVGAEDTPHRRKRAPRGRREHGSR